MNDFASKVFAGIIGGLISSVVAYVASLKTRRLTVKLAERKELDDFLSDAAEYRADAEKFVEISQEIHGSGVVSRDDIDNLFKLHSVDYTPATPKLLQRAVQRLPDHVLVKLKTSQEKRAALAFAYKDLLLKRSKDSAPLEREELHEFQLMIEDAHRFTGAASEALAVEIERLNEQLATLRRG